MKKNILFLFVFIAIGFNSKAQSENFKTFKVHVSPLTSFLFPAYANGYGTGFSFSVEPAYNIDDNMTVGLRLEGAAFASGNQSSGGGALVGSYIFTGDYSFGEEINRVFAGLGLGLFNGATVNYTTSSGSTEIAGGSGFGAVPRVGYQLSHLRLVAEYNIAPKNMSYFELKAAVTFGGGEK